MLSCALAYARKLICYGMRGDKWCNKVMQDMGLISPWLTLEDGALREAFEQPDFWDAANAVGDLLGFPLYPICEADLRLVSERDHLRDEEYCK